MEYLEHKSVLLNEIYEALSPALMNVENPLYADLTFGRGGHTLHFLQSLPELKALAFDQDLEAFGNGQKMIQERGLERRLFLKHSNFVHFSDVLDAFLNEEKMQGPHAILLDLGVSSHQFDSGDRGMSFRHEAELDMRMDQSAAIPTAKDLVNDLSQDELFEIFKNYGEEMFSKKIAQKIVEVRKTTPIVTTKDLENIIFHCYPPQKRHGRVHPATRCFQALRIAVNRELDVLSEILPELFNRLRPGGRLAVISFHSLEDRIVKHTFRNKQKECPDQFKVLTKRPMLPSEEEINANFRARSAKLRVLEKTC